MTTGPFISRVGVALASIAILITGVMPASAGPEDEAFALLMRADNFRAAGMTPTSIFVSWVDTAPAETLYRIEASTDEAGPYAEVATHDCAGAIPSTPVRLPQFGQTCGREIGWGPASSPIPIFLRVVPLINVGGTTLVEGLASHPYPAILGPAPPTDLRCNGGGDTACLNVNSVTLTWIDNSDEAEFWIMRARGAVNPQFGTTPHAVVPANTTTFHEFLDEFSATFFYRVVAVRKLNVPRLDGSVTPIQSFSNSLNAGDLLDRVKVETAPVPPPTDPSGLSVTFTPPSTAKLTWTDKEFNPGRFYIDEDGWFIEWGPSDGKFEFQTSKKPHSGQGVVTFTDDDVPPDTRRCFRVRGWRAGPAYSGYTNTACLESIPAKPSNVAAVALDNATVKVTWKDNSDSESAFIVQRCTGSCTHSSTWTDVGSTPENIKTFIDISTFGNTTYSYRVLAENSAGRSAASNIAKVTTPSAPVAKPTNLLATPTGSHEITLTWTDNASDETGFRIEFEQPDGSWETLDEVGPRSGTGKTVTYVDRMSLAAKEKRCYRVRALKVNKSSDPSNKSCATTFPAAAPNGDPTGLSATPISNVRVDLQWTDNATNEDKFRIEAVVFPNKPCPQNPTGMTFQEIGFAPKHPATGTTNFAVKGLQPHSAYFFRVVAVNLDGESAPSNVSGCAQTLGPPLPIFIDPATDGDIKATRCEVVIEASATLVNRVKLLVNAFVPETGIGHTDVVWADAPSSGNRWTLKYKFRRGVTYGLIARSFGPQPNEYHSGEQGLRDIKVLADCPLEL